MKPFLFLSLSVLAASLLTACEPNKDVVTPQTVQAKNAARTAAQYIDYSTINLANPRFFDNGKQPAVALSEFGYAIEVHKSQNNDYLWYHVAKNITAGSTSLAWGSSKKLKGTIGKDPAVAVSGNNCVVVYNDKSGNMGCFVGTYTNGDYEFSDALIIGQTTSSSPTKNDEVKGTNMSVAICGNNVIILYEKNSKLYYIVGSLSITSNSKSITWKGNAHGYADGKNPSIAANGTQFVEVHQSSTDNWMLYSVGRVNMYGETLDSGTPTKYMTGEQPSVAIDFLGNVVQVHKSEWDNSIWRMVGSFDPNAYKSNLDVPITFTKPDYIAQGSLPAVSLMNYQVSSGKRGAELFLMLSDGDKKLNFTCNGKVYYY